MPPASILFQININKENCSEDETWHQETATKSSIVESTYNKDKYKEKIEEEYNKDNNLEIESLNKKKLRHYL